MRFQSGMIMGNMRMAENEYHEKMLRLGQRDYERRATMSDDKIVDYVQIVQDANGQYRVRAKSNNGDTIWTTEQYGDEAWALAVALDSGKPLKSETNDA